MKRATVSLLTASLTTILLLTPSHAASEFEGRVTVRTVRLSTPAIMRFTNGATPDDARKILDVPVEKIVSAGGEGVEVEKQTFTIKGARVRFDGLGPQQPGYAIVDTDTGEIYMVRPGREVIKSTRGEREQMAEQVGALRRRLQGALAGADLTDQQRASLAGILGAGKPAASKPTVTQLDDRAEVNGSTAEAWKAESGPYLAIGWVTPDHPGLQAVYRGMQLERPEIAGPRDFFDDAAELIAAHGLPTRMQELDLANVHTAEYRVVDLVSVEPAAVDDATVTLPADLPVKTVGDLAREHMRPPPGSQPPGGMPPGFQPPAGVQMPPGMRQPQP